MKVEDNILALKKNIFSRIHCKVAPSSQFAITASGVLLSATISSNTQLFGKAVQTASLEFSTMVRYNFEIVKSAYESTQLVCEFLKSRLWQRFTCE
jgi:hypothetical protein